MKLHYLQHVSFEKLGYIEHWVQAKGFAINPIPIYKGPSYLPHPEDVDWLIIMGGPMSVYEENKYPWLVTEKKFIETVIEQGKPVLGICLGAQLIADVLGVKVYPGEYKEIGWFPVKVKEKSKKREFFSGFPNEFVAFHWHGDTFDIPQSALWVAESQACPHQGFIYGKNVVALQFHLEMTEKGIVSLIKNCAQDLTKGPYVQSPQEMLDQKLHLETSNNLMARLLDNILKTYIKS